MVIFHSYVSLPEGTRRIPRAIFQVIDTCAHYDWYASGSQPKSLVLGMGKGKGLATCNRSSMETHIFNIFQHFSTIRPSNLILWIESASLCTQARYDLTDPQALARFLQDSDVRLVRAKCGPQAPCRTSTIKDTGVG